MGAGAPEVRAERMVSGGAALGRDADGEVVLVEGALPGETVIIDIGSRRRGGVLRGRTIAVVDPSPDRVEPPCPAVARGCGGCRWQHADPAAQVRYKVDIVVDALTRVGGFGPDEVDVAATPALPPMGARTTLRMAVAAGRPGFRGHRSHEVVDVDACPVAHPLLDDLIATTDFGTAREATLRCGARTGDRLLVAAPDALDVEAAPDVVVVGADELEAGAPAWFHELAAGRRWRISAGAFFQARPDGAEALVGAVAAAAGDALAGDAVLLDAYCGVGLFGGALDGASRVVGVESHPAAAADAVVNLADRDAEVVRGDVAAWVPEGVDVAVADPARSGLGPDAAAVIAATGAGRLVLVSCDGAACARDARLLREEGYMPVSATVVDLFPHTPHVEVVTRFDRVPQGQA